MVEKNKYRPVSLNEYHPLGPDDVVLIVGKDVLIPEHEEIQPGKIAMWKIVENKNEKRTLVISNLIHKEFPHTYCQIQMIFTEKNSNVFTADSGPREKNIPLELVHRISVANILPQIQKRLGIDE